MHQALYKHRIFLSIITLYVPNPCPIREREMIIIVNAFNLLTAIFVNHTSNAETIGHHGWGQVTSSPPPPPPLVPVK